MKLLQNCTLLSGYSFGVIVMKILSTIKPAIQYFPYPKSIAVIILWIQLALLGGCASTLDYDPTLLRFDSPEVSGGILSGNAQYQFAVTDRRVMAKIDQEMFDTEFTDSSEATVEKASTLGVRSDVGLSENVDVYIRAQSGTASVVGAKLQFVGSTHNKIENGLKISASAEFGYSNDSSVKGDRKTLSMISSDYSINIGYRFTSNLIVYMNNFYNRNDIKGSLGRGGNTKYSISGVSNGFGSLYGVRYQMGKHEKFFGWIVRPHVTMEFGGGNFSWLNTKDHERGDVILNNQKEKSSGAWGISAGFAWD